MNVVDFSQHIKGSHAWYVLVLEKLLKKGQDFLFYTFFNVQMDFWWVDGFFST